MTRRQLISIAGFSTLSAVAYPTLVEPRWLELTTTEVQLEKKRSERRIRILHLADFHASFLVPQYLIDQAIDMGLQQRPDLACLTGDFITSRRGFNSEMYESSLRRLAQAVPTYAVLGNHDGGKWAPLRGGFPNHSVVDQILDRSGVELLQNRSQMIRCRGREVSIVGVGDLWSEEIDSTSAFADVDSQKAILLLSHNPDSKAILQDYPWHLMLCGHTQGGQVIIPFEGPRYAPVEDKRFVCGLKS